MRKTIMRIQAVLLSVLMLLSSVPAALAAEAEATTELPEYTAQLYQGSYDETAPDQNKVVSGMELSQEAELYYVITKAHMVNADAPSPSDVQEGVTYRITLPEPLVCRATLSQNIVAEYEDTAGTVKSLTIGTFSMTEGAPFLAVCFEIPKGEDNPDGVTLEWLTDFHLSFGCKMDKDALADKVDGAGRLTINLPGGENLELTISEFEPIEPVAPVIAKSSSGMTEQGETTWTITYTPGNQTYTDEIPTRLVDTLPQGLQLVEDSITISPQDGASLVTGDAAQDGETPASPLTFSIAGDKAVTISYRTTLAPEKWLEVFGTNGTWTGSFTNSVQGYVQDQDTLEWNAWKDPAVSRTQGSIPNTFLSKKSSNINYDKDTKTYSVTWTISVRPRGQVFDTLVLTDKMGAKLILPDDLSQLNMAIEYPGEYPDGAPVIPVDQLEKLADGTLKITFDQEILEKIAGKDFDLTYTTRVDQAAIQDPAVDMAELGNQIQAQGESGGKSFTTPTISYTPANAKQVLITHNGVKADTTTRTLTWETTINPARTGTGWELPSPNLTQVVYRNVLPKNSWHSFGWTDEMRQEVEQEVRTNIETALDNQKLPKEALQSVSIRKEGENWVLEVILEGTGDKPIAFQYHTHAQDPKVWAGNRSNYQYSNTVYLEKDGTTIDDVPLAANASDTGNLRVAGGTALRKWPMDAYDPANRVLTWELMINERRANLGDIQIEEMLPAGMGYVPGSAKIGYDRNNNQLSQHLTDDQVVVSPEENKVTFLLDGVTQFCRIQFDVQVDVDQLTQTSTSFKNTANLYVRNDALPETPWVNTASASEMASIVNNLLTKTGGEVTTGSDNSRSVTYTVKLNPLGMDLTQLVENAQDGVFLVDTMDDGLVVDLDSVRLYEGVVGTASKPNGMTHRYTPEVKQGAEVEEPEISFDSWENQLRIRIPDPQKAYYVTYTAYVVKPNVTLNNHIELEGSTIQSGGGSFGAGNAQVKVSVKVGVTLRPPTAKYVSISLEKIAADTKDKLPGAEYGLYTEEYVESSLVARGVTDQEGVCVLSVPKQALGGKTTVYIKELSAPEGYLVDRTWHEVSIDPSGNQPVLTLENQRETEETSGRVEVTVGIESVESEVPFDPWAVTQFPFMLYVKWEDGESMGPPVFEDPLYPDRDGSLVVDGLDPNKEYVLIPDEENFPEGYVPPEPQPVTPNEEPLDVTVQVKEEGGEDPDGGDGENPGGGDGENPGGGDGENPGGGDGENPGGGDGENPGGGGENPGDGDGENPGSGGGGNPGGGGENPGGGGGNPGGGSEKPDDGEKPDVSTPDGGETPDVGTPNGGETPDIGTSDGGETPDIGTPDSGETPDVDNPNSSESDLQANDTSDQSSSSKPSIPKTGVRDSKALWLGGFALSLTAACLLLTTGRKGRGAAKRH